MNRATQLLLLFALTSIGLAVGPAPGEPASKPKEAIAQERITLCADGLRMAMAQFDSGVGTIDVVANWSRRLMDSQRAAGLPKEELLAALRKHIAFLTNAEERTKRLLEAGLCHPLGVRTATYARLEAQQWLAEAEGK